MVESIKGKKVLVCDDDAGILEVIQIILEENNFVVKTLSNGKSIRKIIDEFKPDVLLLDIWMPGIDGEEITKIIKRDKTTKDLPVILITALNQPENLVKGTGADDYLAKPFDMDDLVAKVTKYVS